MASMAIRPKMKERAEVPAEILAYRTLPRGLGSPPRDMKNAARRNRVTTLKATWATVMPNATDTASGVASVKVTFEPGSEKAL